MGRLTADELWEQRRNKKSSVEAETKRPTVDELWKLRSESKENYTYEVDNDYINSFLKDSETYFTDAQSRFDNMTVDDAKGSAANFYKSGNSTRMKADTIRAYINYNKDKLGEDAYKSLDEALKLYDSNYNEVYKAFKDKEDLMSQYSSQEDYDAALKEYLEQQDEEKKIQAKIDSGEAAKGWEKYITDQDKKEKDKKAAREEQAQRGETYNHAIISGLNAPRNGLEIIGQGNNEILRGLKEDDSYMKPTDEWTEDEQNRFGAYYIDNPQKAYDYATEVNNKKNKEKKDAKIKEIQASATDNVGSGILHTIGSIPTSFLGIADTIAKYDGQLARGVITEDGEVSPGEYAGAVQEGIGTKLNEFGTIDTPLGEKGWGDLYSQFVSTTDSAVLAPLNALPGGKFITGLIHFGKAAASAIDDARARGSSDRDAIKYGTLVGLAEAVSEALGIERLFKLTKGITVKEVITNILKQAGAEGLEESTSNILSEFADRLVMQDKSKYQLEIKSLMSQGYTEEEAKATATKHLAQDTASAFVGGAISGGIHAGGATAIRNAQYNNQVTKNYYMDGITQQDLVTEGLELEKGTVANKLATKYQKKLDAGKTLSKGQTRRQIVANEYTIEKADAAKIEKAVVKRFNELGENSQNVNLEKAAKGLVKELTGEALTLREKNALKNSKYADRIRNEMSADNIKSGGYSSDWAERIGTDRINADVYRRLYDVAMEKNAVETPEEVVTQSENVVADDSDLDIQKEKLPSAPVATSGKTFLAGTKEAVRITDILTDESGKTKVRLDNGRNVDVRSLDFNSKDEGLVYEAVADMGLPPEASKMLIENYDPKALDAPKYIKGVEHAFAYGRYNMPTAELAKDDYALLLDPVQRKTAYDIGKLANKLRIENDKQNKKELLKTKISRGENKKAGSVTYLFDATKKKMTDIQKTSVKGVEALSKATGVKFVIYDSYVDESGKRVYKDENGEIKEAPNGYYKSSESTIYLDINAGQNAEGTVLFTASHELTHFIKQWSEEKFQTLADFLMEQYGKKGVPVNQLVREQMDKAERNGRKLSYDEAYEEVIADSCEQMLADGKVIKKLAQKDMTLFEKIKSFIDDLASKIKSAYSKLKPDSKEAKYVAEMADAAEELQNLFADALEDASENYKSSPENLDSEGQKEYNNMQSETKLSGRYSNEKYTEQQYNNFGWASYGGLITPAEREALLSNYTGHKHNNEKFPITPNGETVLHAGTVYGMLMYVRGDIDNPEITKIVLITTERETANTIERWILKNEYEQIPQPFESIESCYGEEVLCTYRKQDFASYREYRSELEGRSGKTSYSFSGEEQDGRRSFGESKGSSGKSEIKYSQRDPAYLEQKEKVDAILEKENAKLREDNEYLRQLLKIQKTVTGGTKFTKTSIEAAAGHLMRISHARGNKSEFVPLLNNFYGYIASGEDITWDSIKEKAMPAVNWLQNNVYIKPVRTQETQDILNFVRNCRVYLDEEQQQEVAYKYGSYNEFRKKTMGRITLSNDARISLDTQWQELSEMFPQYFDPGISSNDQPFALMEAIDTLQNVEENTLAEYEADADLIAQELLTEVYDSYWNVSTLHTVADRKQAEINRLKYKHGQAIAKLKEDHKNKVTELQNEHKEKIKQLKQKHSKRLEEQEKNLTAAFRESRRKATENKKKTEVRHKIFNVIETLNSMLKADSKKKHIADVLKPTVISSLKMFNVNVEEISNEIAQYDKLIASETDPKKIRAYETSIDELFRQVGSISLKLSEFKKAYHSIKDSPDITVANIYDEVVENVIEATINMVGNTPVKDMSLEQLESVHGMYKMVLSRVRDHNRNFIALKKATSEELALKVMDEIRGFSKSGKRLALLDEIKSFGWNNLKPAYAFEVIGSDTLKQLYNNVRKGEDVWAVDVEEAKVFAEEMRKRYSFKDWDFKKTHEFTANNGEKFKLTLEQMMSLYAYSKRKQADEHLDIGGFVFDDSIEVTEKPKAGVPIKYKVNDANPYAVGRKTLFEIVETLTPAQRGYVDEMQEYLSGVMGEKGNEISLQMYGIRLFKEKHYFPLKSAQQYMYINNKVPGELKIKNSGFTKGTVPGADNPIILQNFSDVWGNHIHDMAMYHGFVLPLEDFNKVFNYRTSMATDKESIKGYLQNAFGKQAQNYISGLLVDLNKGARLKDTTTSISNKSISKFKKAATMASLSVIIQQPSAFARATAYIDWKYMLSTRPKPVKTQKIWDEVKRYAPVAIIKEMGVFDVHTSRSTVDWINGNVVNGKRKFMGKLDDFLSTPTEYMDKMTWCWIWEAVKKETQTLKNFKSGSEEFFKACGERFTEIISMTQVYDSVLSRSAMMRSQDTAAKMATAFKAEPTVNQNMLINAIIQGKRGNRKYARKAITGVITSMIINSALAAVVYAGRDDDEDETYQEKYIGSLINQLIDSTNPLNLFPYLSDIASLIDGYDVERSDMSIIADVIDSFNNLTSDSKSIYRKTEDFAGSIAAIFGLPVKNIMRDFRGVYNVINTAINGPDTTPEGLKRAIREAITGKEDSKQRQVFDAYVSGDEEEIERVLELYDGDESEVASKITKAVKEYYISGDIDSDTATQYLIQYAGKDEDEVYWDIREWDYIAGNSSGDGYSKYGNFYTAVETGIDLRTIINEYISNGVDESDLAGQITKHFKPIYKEMSNTERARLQSYLLNAYEMILTDGMTAEEKEAFRERKKKEISKWLEE